MSISIIVAYDKNRGIGYKGNLPWRIPEDLKHFKETTKGGSIIMGRKTWESLPGRFHLLPHRYNIIISKTMSTHMARTKVGSNYVDSAGVSSVEDAIALARKKNNDIFIIGGGQIYDYAVKNSLVDKIIASEVKGDYETDVWFTNPEWHWPAVNSQVIKQFDDFDIVEYVRN